MEKLQGPFQWGDDSPWTQGDAREAVKTGEELAQPIILQAIVNTEGETLCFVEYHLIGNDDDNAKGLRVFRAVNSHEALVLACNEALNYMGRQVPGETQDLLRAALDLAVHND